MVKFIIKINCTDINNLSFNKKKITKKNPPDLILGNISCIFPYIKSIKIIHKELYNFTTKTLEFFCENDDELSDDDFIHFIEVLKKFGFHSNDKTEIRYVEIINQKHVVSKIRYFTSLEEIAETHPKGPRKPNRSKYMTELLYICKNLTV